MKRKPISAPRLSKAREGASSGQIGVRDPFQLIRHLARSQSDPRLAGLVDFPHLEVAPGSRRGFVPNQAAVDMARELTAIEPLILERLKEKGAASTARLSADLHRQLARLFARATSFVPHLEWFPVSGQQPKLGEGAAGDPSAARAGGRVGRGAERV